MFDYSAIGTADGAIVIPEGSLDRWFAYRETLAAERRDVVVFGDSTTYGSGGLYSWVQRLRDRAVDYGMADGGKGLFAGGESDIEYDAPEVNGFVSTTFTGFADSFDTLDGGFFYDDGTPDNAELVLQFRATACRLWYVRRPAAGEFTYQLNDDDPVVVNANKTGNSDPTFVYLSGLAAGVTHTLTITNTGTGAVYVACAPINETGVAFQKQARSGGQFAGWFFNHLGSSPWTQAQFLFRAQAAMGLEGTTVGPPYTGAAVDSRNPTGAVNPVLAVTHLGFNDLTNSVDGDVASWEEYVKKFAGLCSDADCDGIVISGQLPYNAQWPTYGPDRFAALRDTAAAEGLGFVDLFYPIEGHSLDYAGPGGNPHLTREQYEDQADFLWDNVLGAHVTIDTLERAASIATTATVSITGRRVVGRAAQLAGSPSLTVSGRRVLSRAAVVSAASSVTVAGGRTLPGRFGRQRTRSSAPAAAAPRSARMVARWRRLRP